MLRWLMAAVLPVYLLFVLAVPSLGQT